MPLAPALLTPIVVPVIESGEIGGIKHMQKLSLVLLVSAAIMVTNGCATKKYVRNTVTTSSDTLTARIEGNEGEIKEVRDDADKKVSGVDARVSELDSKTSEQFGAVKTDVQNADQKASHAQSAADRVAGDVTTLDQKFQNRNQFNVTDEKSVQFKLNSA